MCIQFAIFEKEATLQPHRYRYWLNANPDDPAEFRQQVRYICQLHQQALELLRQGIHVVSTDEMSGIQALERLHPTLSVRPKRIERIEFEYIRHGTQTLLANWHVAKGELIHPTIPLLSLSGYSE